MRIVKKKAQNKKAQNRALNFSNHTKCKKISYPGLRLRLQQTQVVLAFAVAVDFFKRNPDKGWIKVRWKFSDFLNQFKNSYGPPFVTKLTKRKHNLQRKRKWCLRLRLRSIFWNATRGMETFFETFFVRVLAQNIFN